jgi:hypothetical protein
MKIKTLVFAVFFGFITTAGLSAFGIGAQLNGNASEVFVPGAALLISPGDTTHLALNWYFGERTNTLGLTADFWFLDPVLSSFGAGSINFFLGGGLYGNLLLVQDGGKSSFSGGVRLPLGLHLLLSRNVFEFFVQAAPSIGLRFYPDFGGADNFFCPIALGVRFWFR